MNGILYPYNFVASNYSILLGKPIAMWNRLVYLSLYRFCATIYSREWYYSYHKCSDMTIIPLLSEKTGKRFYEKL